MRRRDSRRTHPVVSGISRDRRGTRRQTGGWQTLLARRSDLRNAGVRIRCSDVLHQYRIRGSRRCYRGGNRRWTHRRDFFLPRRDQAHGYERRWAIVEFPWEITATPSGSTERRNEPPKPCGARCCSSAGMCGCSRQPCRMRISLPAESPGSFTSACRHRTGMDRSTRQRDVLSPAKQALWLPISTAANHGIYKLAHTCSPRHRHYIKS